MKTQDAQIQLKHEIAAAQRRLNDYYDRIRLEEERIEALEKLLRYCVCPKCGAELQDTTGSTQNAVDMMEAAEEAGRKDVPCAFCDTPEQRSAHEGALDRVKN